ncbi:MAG: hypothetical protein WCO09_04890 [bacterium]
MIETLKKFKYLIIIVVVLVAAFIAYTVYTSSSPATDSASLQRTTASGSSASNVVPSTGSVVPDNELAKSFVDQLLAIQSINLKVAFFADPVFTNLVDNHKGIDPQPIGRQNPFAPIGSDGASASNNYQDINGDVIPSTGGSPATSGSESTLSPASTKAPIQTGSVGKTKSGTTGTTKKKTTTTNAQ